MSEKEKNGRTIKYAGKNYSLSPEACAFMDSVMSKGITEDVAFAAYQAAAGSGAVKVSAKPKEVVPNVAEMAQAVVNRGLKRNKSLQAAVNAYFHEVDSLDSMTSEAGFGDGFLFGGSAQSYVRIVKDVGLDGIKTTELKLDPESDIAKTANGILDAHRHASSAVMKIVAGVAKKNEIDPCPTVGIDLQDRDTIVLSQKVKRTRSGGGGGRTGGDRAKYKIDVAADGSVSASFTYKDKEYGPVTAKDSETMTAEWERIHKEADKPAYTSSYKNKDWWPQS